MYISPSLQIRLHYLYNNLQPLPYIPINIHKWQYKVLTNMVEIKYFLLSFRSCFSNKSYSKVLEYFERKACKHFFLFQTNCTKFNKYFLNRRCLQIVDYIVLQYDNILCTWHYHLQIGLH